MRATDAYGAHLRDADDTIVIDHEDPLDTQTGRERGILRRAEHGHWSWIQGSGVFWTIDPPRQG